MTPEHFRALNFKGYIDEYDAGRIVGNNKLFRPQRRWSYQQELFVALTTRQFELAANLMGLLDTMPEDTPNQMLRRRRMRSTPITDRPVKRKRMLGKATSKPNV